MIITLWIAFGIGLTLLAIGAANVYHGHHGNLPTDQASYIMGLVIVVLTTIVMLPVSGSLLITYTAFSPWAIMILTLSPLTCILIAMVYIVREWR